MKFLAPLAVLAAGAAAIEPLTARTRTDPLDISEYTLVVSKTLEALQVWDKAVLAYDGGAYADLVSATLGMNATVYKAIADAEALEKMNYEQADRFTPVAESFAAGVKQFASDFESKIPVFAKGHLCQVLLERVTEIGDRLLALTYTLVSKVPKEAKDNFEPVFKSLDKSLGGIKEKLKGCATGPTGSDAWPTSTAGSNSTATKSWGYGGGTSYVTATIQKPCTKCSHDKPTSTPTTPSTTCDETIVPTTPSTTCDETIIPTTPSTTCDETTTPPGEPCTKCHNSTTPPPPSTTCTDTWTTSKTGGPGYPCKTCGAQTASTSIPTGGAAPTGLPVGGVVAFALLPLLF